MVGRLLIDAGSCALLGIGQDEKEPPLTTSQRRVSSDNVRGDLGHQLQLSERRQTMLGMAGIFLLARASDAGGVWSIRSARATPLQLNSPGVGDFGACNRILLKGRSDKTRHLGKRYCPKERANG